MIIRRAKPQDARAITEINVSTWKDTYKGLLDDAILEARKVDEKRIAGWLSRIEDPSFIVLIYEDENILGYLWAGPARDKQCIKNEVYALYVQAKAQRRGVGSGLLKEYKKMIKDDSFYLYALKSNKKADEFYKKMGGVPCLEATRKIEEKNHIIEEICYIFK